MKILHWHLIHEDALISKDLDLIEAQDRISFLEKLNDEQVTQIRKLRENVRKEKLSGVLDFNIGDPTPDKSDARKAYIARVAGFYKDILKPKCFQMISIFHKLLEEETNDRETDNILKIGVYVCREWMKWGEGAVNEQIANQTEAPPNPAEQKEELITQVKL